MQLKIIDFDFYFRTCANLVNNFKNVIPEVVPMATLSPQESHRWSMECSDSRCCYPGHCSSRSWNYRCWNGNESVNVVGWSPLGIGNGIGCCCFRRSCCCGHCECLERMIAVFESKGPLIYSVNSSD